MQPDSGSERVILDTDVKTEFLASHLDDDFESPIVYLLISNKLQ